MTSAVRERAEAATSATWCACSRRRRAVASSFSSHLSRPVFSSAFLACTAPLRRARSSPSMDRDVAASRNGAFLLLSFWHGGARHTDFWCVGRWRSSEIVAESGEKKNNAHRPSSPLSLSPVASRSPPAALTAIPCGARSVALRSDHVSTRHQHHQQQQWPRRASRARWKLSKPQKCVTCSAPSPQLSAPRSLASRKSLAFRCRPLSQSRGQTIQSRRRQNQRENCLPPRQGWKSGASDRC